MLTGNTRTSFPGRLERAWKPVLLFRYVGITLAMWLTAAPLAAHPISMTTTEVDVTLDSIRVKMHVMAEDLVLFHQLKTYGEQHYAAADLGRAAQDENEKRVHRGSIANTRRSRRR